MFLNGPSTIEKVPSLLQIILNCHFVCVPPMQPNRNVQYQMTIFGIGPKFVSQETVFFPAIVEK